MAKVTMVEAKPGLIHFAIELPQEFVEGLKPGASVAIDGVCLTVTDITAGIGFDLMDETLNLTTLVNISVGQLVNVERSLKVGDELGGHLVSGHIHGTARILEIVRTENNVTITLEPPADLAKYIFPKGFITLNGVSLTVIDEENLPKKTPSSPRRSLSVALIPETLARTTFGNAHVGDLVNLEVDQQTRTIVDTIERINL